MSALSVRSTILVVAPPHGPRHILVLIILYSVTGEMPLAFVKTEFQTLLAYAPSTVYIYHEKRFDTFFPGILTSCDQILNIVYKSKGCPPGIEFSAII